jgi:hypothetical protein
MLHEEFLENIISNDEGKVLVALKSINSFSNITYEEGELLFEILRPYLQSENEEIMISARKACSFLKSKFDFNTSEPEIPSKEIQIDHTFKKITQNTDKSWSKVLLFIFLFLFSIGLVFSFFSKKSERKKFVSQDLIQRINSLYATQIKLNLDRRLKQAYSLVLDGIVGRDAGLVYPGSGVPNSIRPFGWFNAKETRLKKALYRRYHYRNQDLDYTGVKRFNEQEITLTYSAQGFPQTKLVCLTSKKIISRFPGLAVMKDEFVYDNKNNITSVYSHLPLINSTERTAKYSYSHENGITIVEKNYKNGSKIDYKFDAQGNLLERITYETSGLIGSKTLFEYNFGKLTKSIYSTESYSEKNFYNYDSSGLLFEGVCFRENQIVRQFSYVYDKEKRLVSSTRKSGDYFWLDEFQYNSQGVLTKKINYLKHSNDPTNKWWPEETYELESTEYF